MGIEFDLIEVYIRRETREPVIYIPAAEVTDKGEQLPDDAVFASQIDIDDVLDGTAGLGLSPSVQVIRKIKF